MKLTEPDTKIKVNRGNLQSLYSYLDEILRNQSSYIDILTSEKTFKKVLVHNIKTLYEKVTKIIFKHYHSLIDYKETLKLSDSEKLCLIKLFSVYPLPLDINFIEYELTKNLLK